MDICLEQLLSLDEEWNNILKQAQLHMSLLEPFIAFRKVLLGILNCKEGMIYHLLLAASTLRKVILMIILNRET